MNATAVTSGVEPAVLHSLAGLLQQLVAGIEKLKLSGKPSLHAAELAQGCTRLQQLQQWLPSAHPLQQQFVKLHKLLPALFQPQTPAATVRLLAAVRLLLQRLQWSAPVDLGTGRVSGSRAALAPLLQLWRWQQAEDDSAAGLLIQPLLLTLLQQLVQQGRSPAPDPAAIGTLLSQMQALLEFGASDEEQATFSELAQAVSLAIVQRRLLNRREQIACWQALWCFVQTRQLPASVLSECNDLAFLQAAQLELGRYRRQLQLFLQQADVKSAAVALLPSYGVLLLHYRLPWILHAVGQRGLAQLCQLWYLCLTVHWQHRLPLAADMLVLWRDMAFVLDLTQWPLCLPCQLGRRHLLLLQQWPALPTRQVERVAFTGVREGEDASVPLDGIPDWLSRAFARLTEAVTAAWFVDAAAYAVHADVLVAELLLLEQAAAAIKLPAIESFCSLLLELHQQAKDPAQATPFPGALLWQAHQHLRDLLDEAAAWQEPVPDLPLIATIKQWLQQQPVPAVSVSPASAACTAMLERVKAFVATLATSVEQPLRFSVELGQALPDARLAACEETLIALLRFLVLEQVQNMPQRRQKLQPLTTTLVLKLDLTDEGIAVEVIEAGIEVAPNAHILKRLRHKLPACVERLYCRTQPGRGRSFSLVV